MQTMKLPVHAPATATALVKSLRVGGKSPAERERQHEALCDRITQFGVSYDGLRNKIQLTKDEQLALQSEDFKTHAKHMHRWADLNMWASPEKTPLDTTIKNWGNIQSTMGFINYDWADSFYDALYFYEHGVANAVHRQWVETADVAIKEDGLPGIKEFLKLNMRDIIMFNRLQQLKQQDANAESVHPEALAIGYLLDKRGVTGLTIMLLGLQSYMTRIEDDPNSALLAHPVSDPKFLAELEPMRGQIPDHSKAQPFTV